MIVTQSRPYIKIVVSVLLSVGLAALPVYLYYFIGTQPDDDKLFAEGLLFWSLGLTFLFSSRYAKDVYLLYLIDSFFRNFAVVGGKYRTLIYGVAFCAVAVIQQARWLFAG